MTFTQDGTQIFQSTSSVWRTTYRGPPPESMQKFQSTSSVWRTTVTSVFSILIILISIHVLRVEDDQPARFGQCKPCNFNPRPPCGGRQLWFIREPGDV